MAYFSNGRFISEYTEYDIASSTNITLQESDSENVIFEGTNASQVNVNFPDATNIEANFYYKLINDTDQDLQLRFNDETNFEILRAKNSKTYYFKEVGTQNGVLNSHQNDIELYLENTFVKSIEQLSFLAEFFTASFTGQQGSVGLNLTAARCTLTSPQTFTGNILVNLDTLYETQTTSRFDLTSSVLTCNLVGKYLVICQTGLIGTNSRSSAENALQFEPSAGGGFTTLNRGHIYTRNTSADEGGAIAFWLGDLAAGDKLQMTATQTSGGAYTTVADSTSLIVVKIG